MRKLFLHLLLSVLPLTALHAQSDIEGAKDHPMFSRMPGFLIVEYTQAFDEADMRLGPDKNEHVEGTRTTVQYNHNTESGKPVPSRLQLKRNYENAITKLGGKLLFQDTDGATYKVTRNGKDIWVGLGSFYEGMSGNEIAGYNLTIVEVAGMKQDITANDIFDALTKDGFIALHINFDTGKSTIKTDSQPIVEQIAQMLKAHPELKVSVEGHTDNVGQPATNKTLSGQRAAAVVKALTGKGIPAPRLTSTGWGQEKPLADNRTEDGRAQNRRVEIVKKS